MRTLAYILVVAAVMTSAPVEANGEPDPLRRLDSLYQLANTDSAYLELLRSSLESSARAYTVAQRERTAIMHVVLGRYYVAQTRFDRADSLLKVAAGLAHDLGDGDRLKACVLFELGRCNIIRNDVGAAVVLLDEALTVASSTAYAELEARIAYGIAHAFSQANDIASALPHLHRALALTKQPKWRLRYLLDLAETEAETGMLGEAEQHLVQAEALITTDTALRTPRLHTSFATYHFQSGHYDEAIERYQRVVEQEVKGGLDRPLVGWCMARISGVHRLAGSYHDAVEQAREGLAWCQRWSLAKEGLHNLEALWKAEAALGRKASAFDHLQQFLRISDSLNAPSISGKVNTTVLGGEFARKQHADSLLRAEHTARREAEHRAEVAQQRNTRNVLLLSGVSFLILASGLWARLRSARLSRAVLQVEKDRSESLLLNILPQEVAEELKAKGSAEAVHIDQVTVLFTDFKGFTAMSEVVTPQQLVRDLNECFSAFDRICEKYGIEKIKTIGDAYMAAGGLPTPNTTHATDVINAALDMRDFIVEGKSRKMAEGRPYFEIRIGVHSGPVVAGIVGLKKFQYDIWGDAVNTAARMESSGEVGRVNISATTHARVKNTPGLRFKTRGKVEAKGKGEMEMWFVERA